MASSGGRAPELRKNVVLNRWVIFSLARAKRTSDFKSKFPRIPTRPNKSALLASAKSTRALLVLKAMCSASPQIPSFSFDE
ncbi:hypothetical protein K1719_037262 [Acacia pycnantha]|nr:hypothetical protein K1719_037262 [Acacia pycnantha]